MGCPDSSSVSPEVSLTSFFKRHPLGFGTSNAPEVSSLNVHGVSASTLSAVQTESPWLGPYHAVTLPFWHVSGHPVKSLSMNLSLLGPL